MKSSLPSSANFLYRLESHEERIEMTFLPDPSGGSCMYDESHEERIEINSLLSYHPPAPHRESHEERIEIEKSLRESSITTLRESHEERIEIIT